MELHSNYNTIIVHGIQSTGDMASDADKTSRRHTFRRHEKKSGVVTMNVSNIQKVLKYYDTQTKYIFLLQTLWQKH